MYVPGPGAGPPKNKWTARQARAGNVACAFRSVTTAVELIQGEARRVRPAVSPTSSQSDQQSIRPIPLPITGLPCRSRAAATDRKPCQRRRPWRNRCPCRRLRRRRRLRSRMRSSIGFAEFSATTKVRGSNSLPPPKRIFGTTAVWARGESSRHARGVLAWP